MNPILLRVSFFVLTCALLFGGFSKNTEAQNMSVNTDWERSAAADNLPDWFTANADRAAAYIDSDGNSFILVASAPAFNDNTHVRILDAETGADAGSLDLSNYPEVGTFQLSDILVSEDNKIFLTNYGENQFNGFQVHLYDDLDDDSPELVLSDFDTVTDSGWGLARTVSITGNYEEGTATIYAISDNGANALARYTQTGAGESFNNTPEIINLSESVGSNPTASAFESGSSAFYQTGGGQPVRKYDSDGTLLGEIPTEVVSSGTSRAIFFNSEDGDDYIAVFDFSNSYAKIVQVPGGSLDDAFVIAETATLGSEANANGTGSVDAMMVNGTIQAYVLATNNGIGAYTITESDDALARLQVIHNAADPGASSVDVYVNGDLYEGDFDFRSATEFRSVPAGVELDIAVAAAGSSDAGDAIATFQFTLNEDETYVLIANGVLDNSEFDTSVNADISFDLFAVADVREEAADGSEVDFFVFHGATDAPAVDVRAGETVLVDNASYGDATSYLSVAPDLYNLDVTLTGDAEAIAASFTVDLSASAGASAVVFASGFLNPEANNDGASFALALALADGTVLVVEPDSDMPVEPLAGEYFIPQGENAQGFESLAMAIEAVNELGLSSETIFYIDEDLEENVQLRINRDDLDENTRLHIRAAAGKDVTIRTNDFRLVDTGYITVGGSGNGTDERHLTFEKNDTGAGFIGLLSNTVDVLFQNVNIVYDEDFGSSTYAVLINRREGGQDTGRADNVTFNNVRIGSETQPFNDAIWLFGSTADAQFWHRDVTISNNEFSVRRSALRTQTHINTVFDGNKVNFYSNGSGELPAVNLNTPIETFTFTNNEISFESSVNEDAATFIGLNATNSLVNEILVANNTFTNASFMSSGSMDNSFYALRHNGAATVAEFQFYHNTVYLTDVGQTGEHSAIGLGGSGSTAASLTARNNVFINDRSANNSFIYQWFDEDLNTDYNNIVIAEGGFVGLIDDAEFELLIDWNDIEQDVNSTEAQVEFVSATDLRLTGGSIGNNDLAGTPLAAVTTDIDGTVRSELAPYKGAFEGDVELMGDVEIGSLALLFPGDGFELQLMDGEADTEVEISWEAPNTTSDVTYTWHADSVGGDFSEPLLRILSDGDGAETTLTLTYQTIDQTLVALGVAEGETANLIWTVTAETDNSVRFADEPFELSITRNLGVSRELSENPKEFSLSQNYPNPFNPTSTIEFTLPAAIDVRLEVYNINGQLVSTLVDSRLNAGQHSVVFDASNLASGVYLYRIIAGNFMETRRMTLIK